MGTVYLAHDTQLDRQVALKIPRARTEDDEKVRARFRARFFREAQAAAALHHPNICPVHDVGAIDGVQYLTMAYIEGQPLSQYLESRGPLPEPEAALLVHKLALALAVAHGRGIVHRDLKPSNMMLNAQGDPVIMDFGLARRDSSDQARLT